jgi:predicted transcriptional regulator
MISCKCCGGSGHDIDNRETGDVLKKARKTSRITQKAMAKALGISAAYLCDLEHGRRHWSSEMVHAFKAQLVPDN